MPDHSHGTIASPVLPEHALAVHSWEQEVLPRLPQGWEKQAKHFQAFSRVRHVRCAADLLRGLLAYVLCVRSFRQLGCWSLLIGLGELSEAAWRKRLRQSIGGMAEMAGQRDVSHLRVYQSLAGSQRTSARPAGGWDASGVRSIRIKLRMVEFGII